MPKTAIQPGQRFQSEIGSVWQVERIPNQSIAPRHVVLVDVNDHTASKMIAEEALMEPRFFRRTD